MKNLFLSILFFATLQTSGQTPVASLTAFLALNINVVAVSSTGGTLNVGGYDATGTYGIYAVPLGPIEVLAVKKKSWIPHVSLLTIPFKVRSAIDTFPQTLQTGLSNAGIAINLFNYKLTRYFNSGKQSTHQFGIGIFASPSAEDLSPENTRNFVNKKSKQLFISTGVSLTYTYNDLTFAIVPAGFDFPTTNDGKKFIYNKKYWWGLGIGITTKLFGLF